MAELKRADVHTAMQDALAAVRNPKSDKHETRKLVLTAVATFAAAFGVSGGTNVVMMINNDPIIKQYKPTLSFASAWIGDGIILPIVNVLIMRTFGDWDVKIGRRNSVVALLAGFGLMGVFQVVQARGGMINYTMPKPWNWTWLGYYHMLYMGSQFTFLFFYVVELYNKWQQGKVTGQQKRHLATILALMTLFAVLLQFDYS